ncbi:MAG: hypothetical protein AAGJ50_15475, partial [Pseudomonadota bacterium]
VQQRWAILATGAGAQLLILLRSEMRKRNHNPRVGGSSPSSATILESAWVRILPYKSEKNNEIKTMSLIRVRLRSLACA